MWGAGGWSVGGAACAGGLVVVVGGERWVRMDGCDWRGGEGVVVVVVVGHGWGVVCVVRQWAR